ncbi:MAG: DUF3127 domain-containing protein [Bacteroidales bacterium]|nr:DUF3127 domain-containing protein [Bacteroidales bacterium]
MAFEITGKVIEIMPVINVSDKFRKREFVIERKESGTGGVFFDFIKFQLTQDKCDIINDSFLNQEVRILFNIKGNKWVKEGKVSYFTNLDAWKVERVNAGQPADTAGQESVPDEPPPPEDEFNDLPF